MFCVVQRGWTSLMKASFEGHDKVVEVLLVGGAKPDSTGLVRCALPTPTVDLQKSPCKSYLAFYIF